MPKASVIIDNIRCIALVLQLQKNVAARLSPFQHAEGCVFSQIGPLLKGGHAYLNMPHFRNNHIPPGIFGNEENIALFVNQVQHQIAKICREIIMDKQTFHTTP